MSEQILQIAGDTDHREVMKVGMYEVQAQTTDGRAWVYVTKFGCDDARAVKLIHAARKAGVINTRYWKQIRRFGSYSTTKGNRI